MKALDLSDGELEEVADIRPQDVEAAKQAWRRDAPPQWKDLLDAEPDEEV